MNMGIDAKVQKFCADITLPPPTTSTTGGARKRNTPIWAQIAEIAVYECPKYERTDAAFLDGEQPYIHYIMW